MYQGTDHQTVWLTVNLIHFGYLNCHIIRFIYVWLSNHCNDYTVQVRNSFKGLDLIDRVPDELWMEVRDIVQETGSKTIPKKKKYKKTKWLSVQALQIAEKRRETKGKEKREDTTI